MILFMLLSGILGYQLLMKCYQHQHKDLLQTRLVTCGHTTLHTHIPAENCWGFLLTPPSSAWSSSITAACSVVAFWEFFWDCLRAFNSVRAQQWGPFFLKSSTSMICAPSQLLLVDVFWLRLNSSWHSISVREHDSLR